MHISRKKGFTLIELLVVLAIISVLATVILGSLNNAKVKSRDTQRISDLQQISKALDLHFDRYNSYTQPETIASDCSTGINGNACGTDSDWAPTSDLRILVTDGFIPSLPVDPINDATYRYTYEPWNAGQVPGELDGKSYDLCATLEIDGSQYCVRRRY